MRWHATAREGTEDASVHFDVLAASVDLDRAAHREALIVLRPHLATVWVDVVPGPGGWPPESSGAVEAARARLAAPAHAREPQRPGRGGRTLSLDPAADAEFAVALELAPFSVAVEAMSRRGRIVYARTRRGEPLRLRLTADERAALGRSVPGVARCLRRTFPAPRRRVRAALLLCAGPAALAGAYAIAARASLGPVPALAVGLAGAVLVVAVGWRVRRRPPIGPRP